MHRCPITYISLMNNLKIKNLKITDYVNMFKGFNDKMQTDSIKKFNLTSNTFPELNNLNLEKLINLETLNVSLTPRYKDIHITQLIESIGKLRINHAEIQLNDVNHFELVVPRYLLQNCNDLGSMKTIPNMRGNSLPEIFNIDEFEFAGLEQKSIRLGNLDY